MACEPHRQLVGLEDPIARDVGHRDFGSRDQVEIVAFDAEQIVGELRELTGPPQRLGGDEKRDVDLPVPVLARVHVEHELDQGAVQARESSAEADESASGELRGQLEIEPAESDAEIGVVQRLEVEARWLADPPFLALSFSSLPSGTVSWVRLGTSRMMLSISARSSDSRISAAFSSSPSRATSVRNGSISSPLDLARPMAFERVLRWCCNA